MGSVCRNPVKLKMEESPAENFEKEKKALYLQPRSAGNPACTGEMGEWLKPAVC